MTEVVLHRLPLLKEQGTFEINSILLGNVVLGTTTRNRYKSEKDKIIKH